MATSNVTQAVDDLTRTAVETTIQNSQPLADFDEFSAAADAADAVLSDADDSDTETETEQTTLLTDGSGDLTADDLGVGDRITVETEGQLGTTNTSQYYIKIVNDDRVFTPDHQMIRISSIDSVEKYADLDEELRSVRAVPRQ